MNSYISKEKFEAESPMRDHETHIVASPCSYLRNKSSPEGVERNGIKGIRKGASVVHRHIKAEERNIHFGTCPCQVIKKVPQSQIVTQRAIKYEKDQD